VEEPAEGRLEVRGEERAPRGGVRLVRDEMARDEELEERGGDLADRRRRLVLEGDSYTHHGTRAAFSKDCDRYNALVADGWTVLRFTWEHVMRRSYLVTEVLTETINRIDAGQRS
jgi:very-short-patch-repair endonuclease